MKFTDTKHVKALRFLNNLEVVEKSLQKEFELGRIDGIKLTGLLSGLAEQRRNLYKAIDVGPDLSVWHTQNNVNKLTPN